MNIFGALFKAFITLLKYLLKILLFLVPPIIILALIIIISFVYFYLYFTKKEKIKPKKRDLNLYFTLNGVNYVIERKYTPYYEPGFLKKIFVLFPRQFVYDYLTQDPNSFDHFGIHLFCGKQGSGKTITAIYLMRKWVKESPRLRVYSNIELEFRDGYLEKWQDILTNDNGIYGTVNFADEIQVFLGSSAESKVIPPELLGEISQQRKQKKAIVGTAQVFGRVAKPLREQTHYVYLPKTFFNCITFVRMAEACDYDNETNKFKKYKGMFFFVHDKYIRECYDTYEKVKRYKDQQFANSSVYLGGNSTGGGTP